jgi:catechol 2,3-dioxygenase-like lactoylglutathione lyase family enzyme
MTDRFDHVFIAPKDFDASLRFYRDVLRLEVKHSWGGDGQPRGAVLARDDISVVLAEPHSADEDHAWQEGRRGSAPTLHLTTDQLDARFSEIGAGGHIRIAPENTHWGSRWFVVEDPDGNMIAYNQR